MTIAPGELDLARGACHKARKLSRRDPAAATETPAMVMPCDA
jgi:hypothetical protein